MLIIATAISHAESSPGPNPANSAIPAISANPAFYNQTLHPITLPSDLDTAIDQAWTAAASLPGFLGEDEGRFLALAAACAPPGGAIVEIGSFKGKSAVILGKIAQRYGMGP